MKAIRDGGLCIYELKERSNQRRYYLSKPICGVSELSIIHDLEKITITAILTEISDKKPIRFCTNAKTRNAVSATMRSELQEGFYPFDQDESTEEMKVCYYEDRQEL